MKRFRIRQFLIVCILSILLPACLTHESKPIDIGDGGILSGKPCHAPCFQNIIPGVTTEAQSMEILSSGLGISVNDCEQWDTRKSGGTRGRRCSNIGITFNDENLVNSVSFSPSRIITIDEIIKVYGNPDGVGISISGIEMQPPVALQLYFDKENMIVYLPEQNNAVYNLEKGTSVNNVGYFDQSAYNIGKKLTQGWQGFGEYSYSDTNVP